MSRVPFRFALCSVLVLAGAVAVGPVRAQTYRETQVANHFQIFVPSQNDSGTRFSALVITAMAGTSTTPCVVDLTDVGDDGDTDDTVLGASLVEGQSLVRYIRDGAVNDDVTGLRDGDYFRIDSTLPVAVFQATDSDWQHDWAPAIDGTMRGTRFVLFANGYSVSQRDVDAFAYEDGTRVEIYDITQAPLVDGSNRPISGVTTLRARPASPVLSVDLDEGEDLVHTHALGRDLFAVGRTYELVATRPVTVLFGAIASLTEGQNQAIDGAGYVPGRGGSSADTDFYFQIPHNTTAPGQQELRVVSFAAGNDVILRGWSAASASFVPIQSWALGTMDHADYVGGTYRLYHLTASAPVAVFEASWFETGSPGTSDDAAFVPGRFVSSAGGQEFLPYLGPPGRQINTTIAGTYTHLYLYAREATPGVTIVDADTGGTIVSRTVDVPARGYVDVRIDEATYASLKRTADGIRPYLRVLSPSPIAVEMANWNDNWMAYATATVVRNPEVELAVPPSAAPGATVTATGSVENTGTEALTNLVVRVDLPPGVTYVEGALGGVPETSVSTGTTGTEVRFDAPSLAPGASLPLVLDVIPQGSAGSSGEVLSIGVSASGDEGGTALSSATGGVVQMVDPGVAGLSELAALAGDRRGTISFLASGAASTLEISRSTSAAGTYAVIATRSHAAGTTSYSVDDTSVTNGSTYYYRVRAIGAGGSESLAGPVVAQPVDRTPAPVPTLGAIGGDRQVTLTVSGSSAPDLLGYRLERRVLGATTWTSITASPIAGPSLLDPGLANGTTYEYRARSQDDDNNYSTYSTIVRATPSVLTSRTTDRVVSFEDLIGPGVNDWDYNDFVVRIVALESSTTAGVQTLTIDYEPIARGAGYVHELRQHVPASGPWTATITRSLGGAPEVLTESGVGAVDLQVLEDTRDALPPVDGAYANTTAAQAAYVDGGTVRIVIQLDPSANPSLGTAPWDPYLVLPYISGANEIHLGAWGGVTETADRSDLSGYPLDFALLSEPTETYWPLEGQPVWRAFGQFSPHRRQGSYPRWFDVPADTLSIWSRGRR